MKRFLQSNPVNMKDWLKFHPYEQSSQSDAYWLKLCNRLLKANISMPLLKELKWSEYKDLTCIIICWFEDIISEAGIWRSFTTEHQRMYGKFLPFYNLDSSYCEDEINQQDICFLTWHFLSLHADSGIVNPFRASIEVFARNTFDILESEYETAPQNTRLKAKLHIAEYPDLHEIRHVMDFLMFSSYLNFHYMNGKLSYFIDLIDKYKGKTENSEIIKYDCRIRLLINSINPLLALRANEQLANIVGKSHVRYSEIKNISRRYSLTCIIKCKTDTYFEAEHIASGQQINLLTSTISDETSVNPLNVGDVIRMNTVKWNNEWALMGIIIILDKNDMGDMEHEKHLFDSEEGKTDIINLYKDCFKEISGGSPLAYFADTDQYRNFLDRFNICISESADGKTLPAGDRNKFHFDGEKTVNVTAFLNHHAQLELYSEWNHAINDPCNPYYKLNESADMEKLIMSTEISADFVKCLIENHLIAFNQDKEIDDTTITDNLDFLLRYFKRDEYFKKPHTITS